MQLLALWREDFPSKTEIGVKVCRAWTWSLESVRGLPSRFQIADTPQNRGKLSMNDNQNKTIGKRQCGANSAAKASATNAMAHGLFPENAAERSPQYER